MRMCKSCNVSIEDKVLRAKFCSKTCANKSRYIKKDDKVKKVKILTLPFLPKRKNTNINSCVTINVNKPISFTSYEDYWKKVNNL